MVVAPLLAQELEDSRNQAAGRSMSALEADMGEVHIMAPLEGPELGEPI